MGDVEAPLEEQQYALLRELTPYAATRHPGRPTLLFATADLEISPALFSRGQYDEAELLAALAVVGAPAGSSFVEVGANIGTTTVALVQQGFSAGIAVEPEPGNYRVLRANLALNDLEDTVQTRRVAVGAVAGSVDLELSPTNFGDHRVRVPGAPGGVQGEGDREVVTVPVVTLDELVASSGLTDVGLVWVDTQGFEAGVLAGGPQVLGSGVPFVVELWPYGLRRAGGLDELIGLVAQHFREVVDVREAVRTGAPRRRPAQQVGDVVAALEGTDYTDLVLLP